MKNNNADQRPQTQRNYRQSQGNKGLVRFELQVNTESKARFEAMVEAAAEEFSAPWDLRQRKAKARAQIFDEITQGTTHEFFELKDQIGALKEEITALSPSFFTSDTTEQIPLPEAIAALPDDPKHLKAVLAKTHRQAQGFKQAAHEHKRQAQQFQALYDTVNKYNDELKEQLKQEGLFVEN